VLGNHRGKQALISETLEKMLGKIEHNKNKNKALSLFPSFKKPFVTAVW
jgi:hypothetical protein